jgi:glyoxylase-like metal-dependent hydrolase (beta-lactamase superfamily II)
VSNVTEIAPGLAYWMAPHPEWEPGENWPEDVLCVYYEAADGSVVIDPLVPRGEEDEFWRFLDAAAERRGKPMRVLLTSPWHARDAAAVADRYDASIWAPPRARWKGPALSTTADLPAGVDALLPEGDVNQALFFIPAVGCLVTGDVFSGTGGRFHVFSDDQDRERLLAWLPRLAALPVQSVLIAHGEPVLADGAARIREAVAEALAGGG